MTRSLLFILCAATAAGCWSVLMSWASNRVHPIAGAGLIEGSALLLVLILLLRHRNELEGAMTPAGAVILVLCGLCVFSVDYFSLRAYGSGLEVSVGAPLLAAGAILIPAVVGTATGEAITWQKVTGIALIGAGVLLLARLPG